MKNYEHFEEYDIEQAEIDGWTYDPWFGDRNPSSVQESIYAFYAIQRAMERDE